MVGVVSCCSSKLVQIFFFLTKIVQIKLINETFFKDEVALNFLRTTRVLFV